MKASDIFLRCLEVQGVSTIFGVPGEENADLMISLLDSPIQFITCNHEQTAAFMADMHGRMTGRPGVCLSTLGPGATNLATGVASANMDHAPLIAIVGQASTKRLHKESHQNMDAISMYKPITKWAISIRDPEVIPEIIEKAFKIAMEGKPGAVMIELPEDIAKLDIDVKPLKIKTVKVNTETGASSHDVDEALKLIAKSKKPLLLLGMGCARMSCDQEIKTFVEKTDIFAASTFMAKGVMPPTDHHSLFCVGLGIRDIALDAFDQADLVICVGYDMVEWHPDRWNEGHAKKIIHIDTSPAEVDKNYLPEVEMIGNINAIMNAINQRITHEHRKDILIFSNIRQKIIDDLGKLNNDNSFPMKPQRVLYDIRNVLHGEDKLFSDVGAHKMWVARQYPTLKSKTTFISNGFCSMGCAIPWATEAKRLKPNDNIVVVCGDGGFLMSMQAVITAVELHLPIIIIVWQDNYYGLIKWKQEATYQKTSHVELHNPDLVALAKSLGCAAIQIEDAMSFKDILTKALTVQNKPTVIILPIDYSENMNLNKQLGEVLPH